MHLTLHLTTRCNLNCDYCYARSGANLCMNEEIVRKAVDLAVGINSGSTGIAFYGGEPLLEKNLTRYAVDYCNYVTRLNGHSFHFKITTNGLLLDEDFVDFATDSGIDIALSIDGIKKAHNFNRKDSGGRGSFDLVDSRVDYLLLRQKYAYAMMVVTPDTLPFYAESVEYIFKRGFRYVFPVLEYGSDWQDGDLNRLEEQYEKLAEIYKRKTLAEEKFFFSPFDLKIAGFIRGCNSADYRCRLGKRQISIAPDGSIYPCIQFVGDGVSGKDYIIGDVWGGLDLARRDMFYEMSLNKSDSCMNCALSERCHNFCSCLNRHATGDMNSVSPFICCSEQILIRIADRLGNDMFHLNSPMFIQKHYNPAYPMISMLEDINF